MKKKDIAHVVLVLGIMIVGYNYINGNEKTIESVDKVIDKTANTITEVGGNVKEASEKIKDIATLDKVYTFEDDNGMIRYAPVKQIEVSGKIIEILGNPKKTSATDMANILFDKNVEYMELSDFDNEMIRNTIRYTTDKKTLDLYTELWGNKR